MLSKITAFGFLAAAIVIGLMCLASITAQFTLTSLDDLSPANEQWSFGRLGIGLLAVDPSAAEAVAPSVNNMTYEVTDANGNTIESKTIPVPAIIPGSNTNQLKPVTEPVAMHLVQEIHDISKLRLVSFGWWQRIGFALYDLVRLASPALLCLGLFFLFRNFSRQQ